MGRQSILILYHDAQGSSFVLFDCNERIMYNDVVETERVDELYDRFSIRLTITNAARSSPPPTGMCTKVQSTGVSEHAFPFHDRQRALTYARSALTIATSPALANVRLPTGLRGLSLPDEEWASWLRIDDEDGQCDRR